MEGLIVHVPVVQCLIGATPQWPSSQSHLQSIVHYRITQQRGPPSYTPKDASAIYAAPTRFYLGRHLGNMGKRNNQPVGAVTVAGDEHDT